MTVVVNASGWHRRLLLGTVWWWVGQLWPPRLHSDGQGGAGVDWQWVAMGGGGWY